MSQSIDILLIEPSNKDASRTLDTIRRKSPQSTSVRVLTGDQAARLCFEQGLFTREPQIPRLIIVDLAAAGDRAKFALRQLRRDPTAQTTAVVIFSARRTGRDILDAHLIGAHMNIMKPTTSAEYAAAVERIVTLWRNGSFNYDQAEAS